MSAPIVAVFVGSLRKQSWNRIAAKALAERAEGKLRFRFVDIGAVSFYNQDLDDSPPADWGVLREAVASADAALFVTPEYNRSVPGVLKNAIDIASRPYGKGALLKKPAAIVSVSVSKIGAFGANQHLRQTLAYLDMPTLGQPELYLGPAADLFDEQGRIKSEETGKLFDKFIDAFAAWIELHVDDDTQAAASASEEARVH